MYKNNAGQLIFSPSDLVLAMRSPFASWMDRLAIEMPDIAAGIEKDHVFYINRLNVAISRAKALAIIVFNPGLEKCAVNSLEQMERASFFCRLINPRDGLN